MKTVTTGLLFTLLLALALAAGCQERVMEDGLGGLLGGDEPADTGAPYADATDDARDDEPVLAEEPSDMIYQDERFTVIKTEGDLVILSPEAIDPDGDAVSYAFTAPFEKGGRWQTAYGDAGEYTVTVTATDTKAASTNAEVLVRILRANRPPTVSCPESVVAKEGETVTIGCAITDADDDQVTVTYAGWMTGDTYTTTYEDAGTHAVTVTASDGKNSPVVQELRVIVQNVNREPIFPLDFPNRIEAVEGDVIIISTDGVYDPDGDTLAFTFSEPFDAKGIWKTTIGDAGHYPVDVAISDGSTSVKRRIDVEVGMINTAPVLKRIPDITVYEGETIRIAVDATDREDEDLDVTVTGWMTSTTYTTGYADAGTYTVKVTVSDGHLSDSQVVHLTVIDRNRPPVFTVPA